MPMTILEFITVISFMVAVFELGYLFGSKRK